MSCRTKKRSGFHTDAMVAHVHHNDKPCSHKPKLKPTVDYTSCELHVCECIAMLQDGQYNNSTSVPPKHIAGCGSLQFSSATCGDGSEMREQWSSPEPSWD